MRFRVRREHYQLRRSIRDGGEAFLENLCCLAKPGTVFIDIGANIGLASVVLAPLVDQVVAFEPTQDSFQDLTFNLRLNSISNVAALPVALSDSVGVVAMRAEPWWGHNAVIGTKGDALGRPVVAMPALKLDSLSGFFFDDLNLDGLTTPVLVKVDVEGHELEVFKGATQFLSQCANVILCFEAWGEEYLEPIVRHLESSGFERFAPPVKLEDSDVFMRKGCG